MSEHPAHRGRCFQSYVQVIDSYEDGQFDIIFIDGRARNACVKHSVPKLAAGGMMVLDDTYRRRYDAAEDSVPKTWTKTIVRGRGPLSRDFNVIKESTFWFKGTEPRPTDAGKVRT